MKKQDYDNICLMTGFIWNEYDKEYMSALTVVVDDEKNFSVDQLEEMSDEQIVGLMETIGNLNYFISLLDKEILKRKIMTAQEMSGANVTPQNAN